MLGLVMQHPPRLHLSYVEGEPYARNSDSFGRFYEPKDQPPPLKIEHWRHIPRLSYCHCVAPKGAILLLCRSHGDLDNCRHCVVLIVSCPKEWQSNISWLTRPEGVEKLISGSESLCCHEPHPKPVGGRCGLLILRILSLAEAMLGFWQSSTNPCFATPSLGHSIPTPPLLKLRGEWTIAHSGLFGAFYKPGISPMQWLSIAEWLLTPCCWLKNLNNYWFQCKKLLPLQSDYVQLINPGHSASWLLAESKCHKPHQ